MTGLFALCEREPQKLKLSTTAGSHQAMADITAYLARRAGVAVQPYQLHDVVDVS